MRAQPEAWGGMRSATVARSAQTTTVTFALHGGYGPDAGDGCAYSMGVNWGASGEHGVSVKSAKGRLIATVRRGADHIKTTAKAEDRAVTVTLGNGDLGDAVTARTAWVAYALSPTCAGAGGLASVFQQAPPNGYAVPTPDARVAVPRGNADDGRSGAPSPTVGHHQSPDSRTHDRSCSMTATPPRSAILDGRRRGILNTSPASFSNPKGPVPTASTISLLARQIASVPHPKIGTKGAVDIDTIPVAMVKVPFRVAKKWIRGAVPNNLVSPRRCTWAVTVHAPFSHRHPYGAHVPEVSSFTALFDAESGHFDGVGTGEGVVDLIAGTHAFGN